MPMGTFNVKLPNYLCQTSIGAGRGLHIRWKNFVFPYPIIIIIIDMHIFQLPFIIIIICIHFQYLKLIYIFSFNKPKAIKV
jgi:hypothetical protein